MNYLLLLLNIDRFIKLHWDISLAMFRTHPKKRTQNNEWKNNHCYITS